MSNPVMSRELIDLDRQIILLAYRSARNATPSGLMDGYMRDWDDDLHNALNRLTAAAKSAAPAPEPAPEQVPLKSGVRQSAC